MPMKKKKKKLTKRMKSTRIINYGTIEVDESKRNQIRRLKPLLITLIMIGCLFYTYCVINNCLINKFDKITDYEQRLTIIATISLAFNSLALILILLESANILMSLSVFKALVALCSTLLTGIYMITIYEIITSYSMIFFSLTLEDINFNRRLRGVIRRQRSKETHRLKI